MKTIFSILVALFIFTSCNINKMEDTVNVSFKGNKFNVESGNLKSFDINTWKHFHYPFEVIVTLESQTTGIKYHSKAANANVFFNEGTETIHLPVGAYNCQVSGGGYPLDSLTHSYSYYVWNIKDTVIFVDASTDVIKFNLDKSSALVIKDMTADIKLIAYRDASLFWTGKGEYDFAYVTPGMYSGLYIDSLGNQTNTDWFKIERDNYYYFLTPTLIKSSIIIPEFKKNEIQF